MSNFNSCEVDILNSALAENLTQTLITIISAQEKLEELEKYKHLVHNTLSTTEKKEKNIPKIKALLAGIQIGKQMLLNKAKSIYSFENIEDLASNLTLNYKNSIENLISSSNENQEKAKTSHHTDVRSEVYDRNNRISSYLNIVTSNLHNQDGKTSLSSIKQQKHEINCNKQQHESKTHNSFDPESIKCISAYIGNNNQHKQTPIAAKKITNGMAEFDICYPPTKIDIFYPRAKINICSDTPQIDLNLPDPLIEYKNFHQSVDINKIKTKSTDSTVASSFLDIKHGSPFNVHSYKPKVQLDSIRTDNLNSKPIILHKNDEKQCEKESVNVVMKHTHSLRHASSIAELTNSKNDTKLETHSNRHSTTHQCSKQKNKNIESETENFIQTMIASGCESLLQHLLQKYIVMDKNCAKNGDIEGSHKVREYNEWLKANYTLNDDEATRIQTYIETWYMNCMMEKLDLTNK